MTAALAADTLLSVWERTLAARPAARTATLLAAFDGAAAPRGIGAGNARLLQLHEALYGRLLQLRSRCPACGEAAEFSADCAALLAGHDDYEERGDESCHFSRDGYRLSYRLPEQADLAAAAESARDSNDFARRLAARCIAAVNADQRAVEPSALPAELLAELSALMETADPLATLSFGLACPACSQPWQAGFDIGDALWRALRASAESLLLDIDALARAYGWTEAEVLALSPTRRAAYLQLVNA